MGKLFRLLIIVVVGYSALCIYFFLFQENYIFYPSKTMYPMPKELSYEDVYFETEDGERLHGWYMDNGSNNTALYFHGNGGNVSFLPYQMRIFDDLGLNALVFDYRGYGKSSGKIRRETDLYKDASAAYEYIVTEKKADPANILLWGSSLGSAVAIDLAISHESRGLIVESAFASVDQLAREHFWYLPTPFMLRYHMSNIDKINDVKTNILIMHGAGDDYISAEHAQKLYTHASSSKTIRIFPNANGHVPLNIYDEYIPTVQEFLTRNNIVH